MRIECLISGTYQLWISDTGTCGIGLLICDVETLDEAESTVDRHPADDKHDVKSLIQLHLYDSEATDE